jgi:hypothetical protein
MIQNNQTKKTQIASVLIHSILVGLYNNLIHSLFGIFTLCQLFSQ